MKFARYLHDTQTPEWKRAYIDYRGLKKRINAIRREQGASDPNGAGISHSRLSEERRSDCCLEGHDLESRSGSGCCTVTEIDEVSRRREQENSHLTRRRGSKWTGAPSADGELTPSIKTLKAQALSGQLIGRKPRTVDPMAVLPLQELLSHLTPQEASFFRYLDVQLDKIQFFYSEREKEALAQTQLLHKQLQALSDHQKIVHKVRKNNLTWYSTVSTALRLKFRSHVVIEMPTRESPRDAAEPSKGETEGSRRAGLRRLSDPDYYMQAREKIRKAVSEHYRGLELLQNYRILNLTGFRKALKKFEKATKASCLPNTATIKSLITYVPIADPSARAIHCRKGAVSKSMLWSDKPLQEMMKEMQELYALVFFHGDSKKAIDRLRGGVQRKTRYFSTLRSGIILGTAMPALASGIYHCTQRETQELIRGWDVLLFFYGLLLVPVLFSLLVGLNLLVWTQSRVNYVFIFELDVRTRMDYQEYFEIPSILFATLCYSFWLSFARIGSSRISPTMWPLAWLALVAFADFWMGDQLCSLVFNLSNLYFFICVYEQGFEVDWNKCANQPAAWLVNFALAALPYLIRLVQCIRRYVDSGLNTHLINGGKYGFGIINYLFYYLWRHEETHYNGWLALWLIFAAVYSTYAMAWDLLMDWSLLRPRAKQFFLREELGYSNHIYLYYVAILSNCLIRFVWVIYIPEAGPNTLIRTFTAGFLEMLRRIQWNFYRLENEHIGNIDQYRATREVPLPYALDTNRYRGGDSGGDSDSQSEPESPESPTSKKTL
ncbi:hypothetical protein NP233_g7722 [Leucocoprinus birnbaumii]|uniref:Xenotropic and polytropic retrovirus receptor 1 n=1 Tax=Leucocoprinus birnbaumii TaxID=56174 RepID=A0AAD5VU60_9AGAR|nr:hypothetical protein NP233_g7722 [Leucocoprinus birnbaumii]